MQHLQRYENWADACTHIHIAVLHRCLLATRQAQQLVAGCRHRGKRVVGGGS